jgi:hypothetical protein
MAILTRPIAWRRKRPSKPFHGFRLSADEQENIRQAMLALHVKYGSWRLVAEAMGVQPKTIKNAMGKSQAPGPVMALRAAKLAGVPYDELVAGKYPRHAGQCPLCGRKR